MKLWSCWIILFRISERDYSLYTGIDSGCNLHYKEAEIISEFIRRERKKAWIALLIGFISLGAAYGLDKRYELKSDLYPPTCVTM